MTINGKLSTSDRLKLGKPIEVWEMLDRSWKWEVYKKYQSEKNEAKNPFARWFCKVFSPIVPDGELGDVYVKDIKASAIKTIDAVKVIEGGIQ